MIDGNLHYYHHNSRLWKKVDRPNNTLETPTDNVTTTTASTAGSTLTATVNPPPPPANDQSKADDLLKLANAKNQFKSTLQGLITQLD